MNKLILIFVLSILLNTAYAQVSINADSSNADASAILDVKSSNKGVLIPRMDSLQRIAISSPATGLLVFETTSSCFWLYNGAAWENLCVSASDNIADTDDDTKIQVEESADEDIIRFDIGGTEYFRMDSGRLEILNTSNSVYIGEEAGVNGVESYDNVLIGFEAGTSNTSGERNSAIGNIAMSTNSSGKTNVAMGNSALQENDYGNSNVAIGSSALENNISGTNNVAIGSDAGLNSVLSGNIYLGHNAGLNETGSDKLYIENSGSSTPLIYGDLANDSLKIYGTLSIGDNYTFPISDGTANQVLLTDGNKKASWQLLGAGSLLGPDNFPVPDFSCMSVVGQVGIDSFVTSMAISGHYNYVVDQESNDLKVIDVSDPLNPIVSGVLDIGDAPTSVAGLGDYAYVVDEDSGDLKVIDVSNPANPTLSGGLDIGLSPVSIAIMGNYVYVAESDPNDLKVIDVSDPANPTLTGSLDVGQVPVSLAVSGNYLYLVNEGGKTGFQVIDVSDPANPALSGVVSMAPSTSSVAASGNFAFVVDPNAGFLTVINVSDPSNPLVVGALNVGIGAFAVTVSGNYAFVANPSGDNLKVIDISDPVNPFLSKNFNVGTFPVLVTVSGNYAYLANFATADLKVIELSCPVALAIDPISGMITETEMPKDDQTLALSDSILSIADGNSVDLSTLKDDLGDHIATTNIRLNGNYLSGDGGNEGIAVNDIGNVGIGTNTPGNKFHLGQSGGIQLTDSEIGNVDVGEGTILYDANYFDVGEAGEGHFNADGGGLAVYDIADGWGAIVSTANMEFLKLDLSSLHIGGNTDPGDGNLIVDGVVKIAGGNPGSGKVLTSDANGNATWKIANEPDIMYANTAGTQTFTNSDVWRAVTPWTSTAPNDNSEAVFKLKATITSRLTGGSGNDNFEFRVEMQFNGLTYYSEVFSYRPDETGADHDNYKIAPYLDYLTPPAVGGNARFRLNVRNTGDNAWEVQDCVLFVTKY